LKILSGDDSIIVHFTQCLDQHHLGDARHEPPQLAESAQGDVANLADLDRLYKTVAAEKGVVHVVVANAGMIEHATIDTATPEHFDRTFNVNARGTFFTVQKALPLMKTGGSIVLVSSGLHLKGLPAHGTYSATKAAMRSFARTWAMELKDRGIRVNNLSPGAIDTPIIDGQFKTKEEAEGAKKMYAQMMPLGRLGRSEEMAAAILFLASEESSFSTAIDLIADGGITQV
jgi:NAD(P)-dependent dehydrogenase (short-subunit alcohol dehydrogenase family)